MGEFKLNINDDDEEYGIASAMGIGHNMAKVHAVSTSRDDIISEEGREGDNDGYHILVGNGMFFLGEKDDEDSLIESVICVVSEMGTVFELSELDLDPKMTGRTMEWYREFGSDEIIATLTVSYDEGTQKYRFALTNEREKTIYCVAGLNTPADVVWLISDTFRYSQTL